MFTSYNNFFLKSNIIYYIILFLFSFFINFFYANLGVFPIDTFFHYDGAFRILKGEYPIKDFWIVSGLVIDLIQSFFFKILGVNWTAYVFHSSLFNFLVTLTVFYFFRSLKIKRSKSLFFSCCFSTLAYTISGTPFVDHHAAFFLLVGTFLLKHGIDKEKASIWFFIILFYFLSFLTKQVPAAYLIISHGLLVLVYIIHNKKIHIFKYIINSMMIIIVLFLLLLLYLNIDLKNFFIQYLDYPRSIGSNRLTNIQFSFEGFFNHYKYIILPLLIIIFILRSKAEKEKKIFFNKKIYIYLIFLFYVVLMIFHQIMTKNQIYIYFLIPIIFGILYSELKSLNFRYKKFFINITLIILLLITSKYHFRFNENRKFHELETTQLADGINGGKINQSLDGLLWINPFFQGEPNDEVDLIKNGISILNQERNEIMLITHYLFLDSITKKNLNYPNRSFTIDGASMPMMGNKYYNYYKNFLLNKINNLQIKKILFFKHENISHLSITNYLDEKCFVKEENEVFFIYHFNC
jgi:hypothetical protein